MNSATADLATTEFVWRTRVYWEDTDGGGVVYYANYLKHLERARTEWLRARGVVQSALAQERQLLFAVVELQLKYHGAARLDDELCISCRPEKVGGASAWLAQQVRRASDGALLVEARVRVASVHAESFKPQPLPAFMHAELR